MTCGMLPDGVADVVAADALGWDGALGALADKGPEDAVLAIGPASQSGEASSGVKNPARTHWPEPSRTVFPEESFQ